MKKRMSKKERLKQTFALTTASLIVLNFMFSPVQPLVSKASNPYQVMSFTQSLRIPIQIKMVIVEL